MKCVASEIKVGSIFSRHSFGKVIDVQGNEVTLRNNEGFEWCIDSSVMEEEFTIADQFDSEAVMSRTDVVNAVLSRPKEAMTICFTKKLDAGAVADALAAGQGIMSPRAWKKKVSKALVGKERVIMGYHNGSLNEHGRLNIVIMDGVRQVDPRTIQWAIVGRVKMVVK